MHHKMPPTRKRPFLQHIIIVEKVLIFNKSRAFPITVIVQNLKYYSLFEIIPDHMNINDDVQIDFTPKIYTKNINKGFNLSNFNTKNFR